MSVSGKSKCWRNCYILRWTNSLVLLGSIPGYDTKQGKRLLGSNGDIYMAEIPEDWRITNDVVHIFKRAVGISL